MEISDTSPATKIHVVVSFLCSPSRRLWPLGLDITNVELTRSEDWKLNIQASQFSASSTFFLIIGRDNPIEKIDDFVDVFELALRSQVDLIESIDLRYPNGLAVRWKLSEEKTLSQTDL